jgi:hypothetical protein
VWQQTESDAHTVGLEIIETFGLPLVDQFFRVACNDLLVRNTVEPSVRPTQLGR